MMFRLVFYLSFVLLALSCRVEEDRTKAENGKPNIVFIISDDQAWNDYGFMGHEMIETPHIDRLASQSLTFTRGYVSAPLCSPSLASMITGLYPHQHGITGNDPDFKTEEKRYSAAWRKERLNHFDTLIQNFKEKPLLTDILSEQGYISFQTGKWWLGSYQDGGFDYGMTHADPERDGRHGDFGLKIGRQGMDTIQSFLDMVQEENDPFFLWYAPFLPHTPHNPPDSLLEKYLKTTESEPIARYRANCEWFDITVGQLLDILEKRELSENTVIFYVCDNGWKQDPQRANRYLEGSKRAPYDLGIRTPLMVHWQGHVEARMDTNTLVSSIDMVPTVLEILNLDKPQGMHGQSLLNQEALQQRNQIFSEVYFHDIESMQKPTLSLKYLVTVKDHWKLIMPSNRNLPDKRMELYRITDDEFEANNLMDQYPDKARDLQQDIIQVLNYPDNLYSSE